MCIESESKIPINLDKQSNRRKKKFVQWSSRSYQPNSFFTPISQSQCAILSSNLFLVVRSTKPDQLVSSEHSEQHPWQLVVGLGVDLGAVECLDWNLEQLQEHQTAGS